MPLIHLLCAYVCVCTCVHVCVHMCACVPLYTHCGHDLCDWKSGPLGPAWATSHFLDLLYSSCFSIEDAGFLTCKMRSLARSVVISFGCPLEIPGSF